MVTAAGRTARWSPVSGTTSPRQPGPLAPPPVPRRPAAPPVPAASGPVPRPIPAAGRVPAPMSARPPRSGADSDAEAMTLPRRSRADRRREGLLPPGEDPLRRWTTDGRRSGSPALPAAGRRRTDPPGPALSPADVPTSASLPATGPAASDDAGWGRQGSGPAAPSAAPRAAAPAPARYPAAGPVPSRRSSDARAAGHLPREGVAPRTTSLPFTPGPPTPAPGSGQPLLDGLRGALPAPAGDRVPRAVPEAVAAVTPRTPAPPVVTARPAARGAASGRGAVPPPVAAAGPADQPPPRAGAPEQVAGPPSSSVGGRAAARLERQAAEAAARRSGRRGSRAAAPGPGGSARDAGPGRGAPPRTIQLLLGMVVVALVVLGVWSFQSPRTQEAAAQTDTGTSAPVSPAAPTAVDAGPSEAAPSDAAPEPRCGCPSPCSTARASAAWPPTSAAGSAPPDGRSTHRAPTARPTSRSAPSSTPTGTRSSRRRPTS